MIPRSWRHLLGSERAIYLGNVLELGLAQTLLQIEFLTPARERFIKEQGAQFDRKKFDAEFDAFMEKTVSKRPWGTLNLPVSQRAEFDEVRLVFGRGLHSHSAQRGSGGMARQGIPVGDVQFSRRLLTRPSLIRPASISRENGASRE